jgi:hypothetical protein
MAQHNGQKVTKNGHFAPNRHIITFFNNLKLLKTQEITASQRQTMLGSLSRSSVRPLASSNPANRKKNKKRKTRIKGKQ